MEMFLLHVFPLPCSEKNLENRLTFSKVIAKTESISTFLWDDTVHIIIEIYFIYLITIVQQFVYNYIDQQTVMDHWH